MTKYACRIMGRGSGHMTEKYEQTGETKVEHARENKIRGLSSCYEIAVNKETYDALSSFIRGKTTMSVSFDASLEGYTELFSLYRFVNEEKTRLNVFLHTDQFGYEEIININFFGTNGNNHINCVTTEGHAYSFYAVDDIAKYDVTHLIGHILERMIKLANMLGDRDDQDNKVIIELAYEYVREVYKRYK